jgi:hypothetical protein
MFIEKPVYSQSGEYLGSLKDLEIINGQATRLFTEKNTYSIHELYAVSDALILKKSTPFPLGQRIPAPSKRDFLTEKDALVTKSVLRRAIQNGKLINFTLSLPPFSFLE